MVIQGTSLLSASELFNLLLDIAPQVLAILLILPVGSVRYMDGINFKQVNVSMILIM